MIKPSVSIAYLSVILLWATTPLTIVWSSQTVHPTFAVLARMLIAVILGGIVISTFRIPFPWNNKARLLYFYSAIGIFGGMSLAYLASTMIPSGTMSLVFGLSPLVSGILSQKLLNTPSFTLSKKIALMIALMGLAVVMKDNLSFGTDIAWGLISIVAAMFLFSYSAVLVKTVDIKVNAIATTTGALLITIPFFICVWFFLDGTLPYQQWSEKSMVAIVYLGVFGSFLGFIAYYYILQYLTASTVSLITLVTPVLAMTLGAWLNNEQVSQTLFIGATLIVLGLGTFLFADRVKDLLTNKRIPT